MAGFIYIGLGKYERAVEEAQKSIELDPDGSIGYLNLADDYIDLDRLADAEAALKRGADRKLEMPDFIVVRYDLAFLKSDDSAMAREVSLSQRDSEAEDWLSHHESFVLAYRGRLREARKVSSQAVELAEPLVIANEQLCSKSEQRCGKHFSAIPPPPRSGRRPHLHSQKIVR